MKIVTWNSQSKFAENFKEIKKQNADIYVIQECENPQITKSEEYGDFASNSIGLETIKTMVWESLQGMM